VIFFPILAKIWLAWQRLLYPCNQKCLLQIDRPRKPFVISNYILVISRRNIFIAISVQKLVATVMPLCPLCTEVSYINSLIVETLSQSQTLHGYVTYNWSYGLFVIFLPIMAKCGCRGKEPCNQNSLLQLGRPRKPHVISNYILVISRRNAFIAILFPKWLPYCPLCHRWIRYCWNTISKRNSAWICRIQLKLWPFL